MQSSAAPSRRDILLQDHGLVSFLFTLTYATIFKSFPNESSPFIFITCYLFQWLHIHTGHTKAAENILAAPAVSSSRQLQPEICGRQGQCKGKRDLLSEMVCESENTFLSISRPVTQEIGSDPFSPFVHLCVHFCFVVIIHCDLAMGVTLGKVRKMGLLKDTDKCRAWLGNLVCFKLPSKLNS